MSAADAPVVLAILCTLATEGKHEYDNTESAPALLAALARTHREMFHAQLGDIRIVRFDGATT